MRESRLSGSVEGVLRNPDPYSDSAVVEPNTQNLLQRGALLYCVGLSECGPGPLRQAKEVHECPAGSVGVKRRKAFSVNFRLSA